MKRKIEKRKLDVLVLSDIHLGTYGCHAKELLKYIKSVDPEIIILNGDIIDIWQFSKRYWPKSHMKVIKHFVSWISKGKEVYYITGNHDEMFRKFVGFELGSFKIENKVVLELDNKKTWFFHGDVFDITMKHSKWIAKLGAIGYDSLIILNRITNYFLELIGKEKLSFSKKIKESVKSAVKFIDNFEDTAINIAIENEFDFVVCGHIHQPKIKTIKSDNKPLTYLNSGDWIENLTALEYVNSKWSIYKYNASHYPASVKNSEQNEFDSIDQTSKELFGQLIADLNFKSI